MRRREFFGVLGGAAAAWPVVARAQQYERMRRVGILLGPAATDPEAQTRVIAFVQGLAQLGWTVGHNVRIDTRWGEGNTEQMRKNAVEMAALAPDVILASTTTAMTTLMQATGTVPIVFVQAIDPVGSDMVDSLARPGRNATGFTSYEFSIGAKWLELLKQIAPSVKRAAVLRDAASPSGIGTFAAIQSVAPSLGIELSPVNLRDAVEIERAITAFAGSANGGVLATGGPLAAAHRNLIIALAARHKLPAVYSSRFYVAAGGLVSYGPDFVDQYLRAAGYVDRILKGEKPADLPVQASTKYELVLNLNTAKALGIDVPATVLARADEVIE
jgi:putative tryptophan/tyrosine transport system substrate-binding protein